MTGQNSNPFFQANFTLSLKLESDGKDKTLPTGAVEKIRLNLHTYGFSCNLQFSTFDNDDVDQMFIAPKVMKATLTFKPTDPTAGTDPIIEMQGIVTDRHFKRLPSNLENIKQTHRLYEIAFCDNARATWEEHYPTNVYIDESMKDVIEKHVNPEIKLKYDWDPIEEKNPITAFSLENKYWIPAYEQSNFYSFLIWYLHQENGILLYDYKEHDYTITGKKKELSGKPLSVFESRVDSKEAGPEWYALPPLCVLPHTPRYNEKGLKHSADALDEEDKENEDSYKSVRREQFDSSNYRVYPEQAHQKIQSSLIPEKTDIEVELIHLKSDISLDKLTPGSFITFKGDLQGNWSSDPCFKGKNFRIRNLYFEANRLGVSEKSIKTVQSFGTYIKALLEDEAETYNDWPRFVPPIFPFFVQGKVFCDIGDKEQSTYKILESEEAPQGQYLVLVPLAGEGKKVVAPFVPAYSGQYYYPFSKDARVMLSLHFRTARIERPIDWDPLARLPAGVQGNQIVLASNGKDKYTIMRHEYVDGKDSVFTIIQSSSEEQTQTVQIKEKDITITVDEKNKKTLFIELNHDSGLTLSLEDKDAGSNQQVIFDGTAMTHTCKGSDGTSIITQKADSVAIDCKAFSVKSETILLDAKDGITQTGANNVTIESKVVDVAAPSVKLG